MRRTHTALMMAMLLLASATNAQTVKGKIIDALSKEAIAGASIRCAHDDCRCGCTSDQLGEFEMKCKDCTAVTVSNIGYGSVLLSVSGQLQYVLLHPSPAQMQEIVVTANRGEGAKRSEAPVAIQNIPQRVIQETKATTADQLLNKVSGVNMVSLGNEQHQMSIRQPITTKSLFLYLENGIPIRTTGLYNHNALLEMNLAAVKNIEVIKGPSSSLYGSEAIGGVVNFISTPPSSVPVSKISMQANTNGFRRVDLNSGFTQGKWGYGLSGYYAEKRNGYPEYSDFHKGTITLRADHRFSQKARLSNQLSITNYYSQMPGGIDSQMFASKSIRNLHTFTYRKVDALRYHSTFSYDWNDRSRLTITGLFRKNSIGQNPAYRIKDDYRYINGVLRGRKDLAHGEINENSFHSLAFIAQHRHRLQWKKAMFIGGVNIDLSPSSYNAAYIRIRKDSISKKYLDYESTDSTLTNYETRLNNYAGFLNFEFSPVEKLKVVASVRYDRFQYRYNNHLPASAYSGAGDTATSFERVSPKIGFTYNFSKNNGVYANYSEGFVPPQVTELYTGVKVPRLAASTFFNYEVGGWVAIIPEKIRADISIYQLKGTNEIVSVKQDDGSYQNENAGETMHRGIEFGLNANPINGLSARISGAVSLHRFISFEEKGISYDKNEMANAPRWIHNAELWYRPSFLEGFRAGLEWQHVGRYFVDPLNTAFYDGYHLVNLRLGYTQKAAEVWVNVLNVTGNYYSNVTTKSSFGYSYQLADRRTFSLGVAYDLASLLNKTKSK